MNNFIKLKDLEILGETVPIFKKEGYQNVEEPKTLESLFFSAKSTNKVEGLSKKAIKHIQKLSQF